MSRYPERVVRGFPAFEDRVRTVLTGTLHHIYPTVHQAPSLWRHVCVKGQHLYPPHSQEAQFLNKQAFPQRGSETVDDDDNNDLYSSISVSSL